MIDFLKIKLDQYYKKSPCAYTAISTLASIFSITFIYSQIDVVISFIKKTYDQTTSVNVISISMFIILLIMAIIIKMCICDNEKKIARHREPLRWIEILTGIFLIISLSIIYVNIMRLLPDEEKELNLFYSMISGSLYGICIPSFLSAVITQKHFVKILVKITAMKEKKRKEKKRKEKKRKVLKYCYGY